MMAVMEAARKGTTPRGGRPRTRPRKSLIGEPLEAAYAAVAAEEMMVQEQHMETEAGRGRGRGKGRGKGKGKSPQQPSFMPQYMPQYMPSFMPEIYAKFYARKCLRILYETTPTTF
ncbi:hypothetical protein FRX31_025372 [Thalictrum thalictroides]|uniref:Uncharacterized protein n=1 Tax=Thalictrum thalictroides TaxID=46969 RepID=A0A7J6VL29_THATH|nr:hypothetical protein FRX31_025372 [Thalictrum thalictroides]